MKYLILAISFTLVGCGGGSSTPTAIETVKEVFVPGDTVTVTEPGETITETVYVVQDCPVIEEPTDTVELVTYYQVSTAIRDGVSIQDRVYDEQGYLLSDYNELDNVLIKYAYDENHNRTSYITERDGLITSYTYSTYDENSNLLTVLNSSGSHQIHTYDEDNHRIKSEIRPNEYEPYAVSLFTYEGDNLVKKEYLSTGRVVNNRYDINDNLIYSDIVINDVTVQVETYTWQEFTEEI